MDDRWHVATLGLGGNIGDPVAAMARVLRAFAERDDCRVEGVSRLYRTPPWGKTDQADFYNSCVRLETRLAPQDLLALCLDIEREMKRVRAERWGPRTIDIDILTYDDMEISDDNLHVPHPRMLQRGFVLMPLADVGAEIKVQGKSIGEWLAVCDITGIAVVSDTGDWWHS